MNINDALAKEYNRGLANGKASVEQKHGHWIDSPFQSYHPMEEDKNGDLILHTHIGGICSNCGFKTGTHKPKYCEECGAKMDEVTE